MGFQDFSFPGSSRSVAQGSCATPSEAAGVPQAQSPGGFGSAMAMAPGWAAVGRVCSAGLRIEPAAAGAPAGGQGVGDGLRFQPVVLPCACRGHPGG
jgi:hypothetical protein